MPDTPHRRGRVAIAGATGFVGKALIDALAADQDVIALSRSARPSPTVGVDWRACDLFSLRDAERGLAGADTAFYLVHSMMPSARLTQGGFADMDLICADNFARAAKACGLRHIVYLGGLVPGPDDGDLSRHLESRLEVERALGSHGVPVTTLRAGLVVGAGGSSFDIMTRLVGRLPIMVGPRWMRSRSQAIALSDAVALLVYALAHPDLAGKAYDIGCPDVLSYADTLRLTGSVLGKRTRVLTLPVQTAKLSLLWVSVITGAPQQLVRPLLDSLRHDLVARDGLALQKRAGLSAMPLRAALERAVTDTKARRSAPASKPAEATVNPPGAVVDDSRVRSVQRLPLPPGRDAAWVAAEYARWLPRFMAPFLRAEVDETRTCRFYAWPLRSPLLVLRFAADRSSPDRQLYYVTGGLLARVRQGARPRLEFRTVLGDRFVLAAIHDFEPRLPWFVYVITQALVHLFVMRSFGRHLASGDVQLDPA
jgi:uncharacterized protein YbjT (DUF2867 family)